MGYRPVVTYSQGRFFFPPPRAQIKKDRLLVISCAKVEFSHPTYSVEEIALPGCWLSVVGLVPADSLCVCVLSDFPHSRRPAWPSGGSYGIVSHADLPCWLLTSTLHVEDMVSALSSHGEGILSAILQEAEAFLGLLHNPTPCMEPCSKLVSGNVC